MPMQADTGPIGNRSKAQDRGLNEAVLGGFSCRAVVYNCFRQAERQGTD